MLLCLKESVEKFKQKFNSFLKPANTYACELGAHLSVNFLKTYLQINIEEMDSLWILYCKFYSTGEYNSLEVSTGRIWEK